ncbi:MAG: GtrA family protein [Bacteroidales bacterium]|nr:GtrA family protein [Bacteroidales bacterium]
MIRKFLEKSGEWIGKKLSIFYHPIFSRFISKETYLYASTGGANTVFDIFLYFIFYNFIFHKELFTFYNIAISPYIAAFLFVFPITFMTGFYLAKYVTFTASSLQGRKQLFRYAVSVGGSIILNYLLIKLLVENFKIYPTPSKMITTVIVVIYSFIIQKFFTFKTGKKQLLKTKATED